MQPLLILTGPTAVGKTNLSIALAKELNGCIVSADSMQVYRGMDIGTAKIMPEEMNGIPHYLIDCLDPTEPFHVAAFQEMAKKSLEEIYAMGKLPILVGGTGFYIQALLYDIDFTDDSSDETLRKSSEERYDKEGPDLLYQELLALDPASKDVIHPHNRKRLIRALEYVTLTKKTISEHNRNERENSSPYDFCYFVLTRDRQTLYERINRRVDIMAEQGLIDEVLHLIENGCKKDMTSMQGIGYREIFEWYENGAKSEELSTAIEKIKIDTRHFAKRQLTWFRRERDVTWVDCDLFSSETEILNTILEIWRKRTHAS